MHLVYNRRRYLFFIAPMVFFFTLFTFVPIVISLSYSFTNFRGLGEVLFIGFNNYVRLFQDEVFYRAIGNTFKIAITSMIVVIPISFFLALVVNRVCFRNTVYKAIFFAPYTIGGIIVGLVWTFTLDPYTGFLNSILNAVGLENLALQWIGGTVLTPFSVGVVGAWSGMGFYMLLWMTGLKGISTDVLEASVIDGASRVKQVRFIILPLLKDSLKMILILTLTGSLKTFESVYMLTGGGPNHYSETMVSYMYTTTFAQRYMGYGMAMAVVEFILALTISVVFLFLLRTEVTD